MVTCAVSTCKNCSGKITKNKDGITFHRFPRDERRRRQWEMAINREAKWTASSSSAVCSEHFESPDFYLTDSGLRRLSCKAVPNINISPCQEAEPTISHQEPIDIKPSDTEEVITLKHKVHRLEIIAENRRKKIHIMWQSKKRLMKKVDRLKNIIKQLIQIKKEYRNV